MKAGDSNDMKAGDSNDMKAGDIIGGVKLSNLFDGYAADVLTGLGIIQNVPRQMKGEKRKYKVLAESGLPTKEVYLTARNEKYTETVEDLISNGTSELESLRDELQEWYDNLPEGFQSGSKGDDLQEAISQLDSACNDVTVPDWLKGKAHTALILPDLNCNSRADRCAQACQQLDAAMGYLDKLEGEAKYISVGDEVDVAIGTVVQLTEEQLGEVKELRDELDNIKSEAENVSFPGMY